MIAKAQVDLWLFYSVCDLFLFVCDYVVHDMTQQAHRKILQFHGYQSYQTKRKLSGVINALG